VGATGGIIANLYEQNKVPISREMAGLMMAAILSDTVLFKSPTCTPRDKAAVEKLSKIAGIDPMKFGMDLLKAKSDVSSKSAKDILMGDFKKFDFSGTKAGVGQIEVMDLTDLAPKRAAILDEMKKMQEAEKLNMVVLMLTDVMKEASDILFVGDAAAAQGFEKAFGGKLANNSIYKEKVLSRKSRSFRPWKAPSRSSPEREGGFPPSCSLLFLEDVSARRFHLLGWTFSPIIRTSGLERCRRAEGGTS